MLSAEQPTVILCLCLLALRPCRAWASSASRGFPCSQQAVENDFFRCSESSPDNSLQHRCAARGLSWSLGAFPCIQVSNPTMGSPLLLPPPPKWCWELKELKEPASKCSGSCWCRGEDCIQLKHRAQTAVPGDRGGKAVYILHDLTQNNLEDRESKQESKQMRTSVYV